jgi:hypothetical protein
MIAAGAPEKNFVLASNAADGGGCANRLSLGSISIDCRLWRPFQLPAAPVVALLRVRGEGLSLTTAAVENLMLMAFTLVGIGTALAIPTLVFPVGRSAD